MKMIQAVVRPEKVNQVLIDMKDVGFIPATRMGVRGRGRQRGLKSREVYYDGLPKENLYTVVSDEDVEQVIRIICKAAQVNHGSAGDGKIFVYPVEKVITISNGMVEE